MPLQLGRLPGILFKTLKISKKEIYRRYLLIKFILMFVLMFLIISNVFGQDRKYVIYADFYPLVNGIGVGGAGIGIGYDYNIHRFFSVGGYFAIYSSFSDHNHIALDVFTNFKFNLAKTVIGDPYIDFGLGYRRRRGGAIEENDIHSLGGLANMGYRFILKNGLVLEPGFGIRFNVLTIEGYERNNFGYNAKIIMGWAF